MESDPCFPDISMDINQVYFVLWGPQTSSETHIVTHSNWKADLSVCIGQEEGTIDQ